MAVDDTDNMANHDEQAMESSFDEPGHAAARPHHDEDGLHEEQASGQDAADDADVTAFRADAEEDADAEAAAVEAQDEYQHVVAVDGEEDGVDETGQGEAPAVAASAAEDEPALFGDEPQPVEAAFAEALRISEALLFASAEPLDTAEIAKRLPEGVNAKAVLQQLQAMYQGRGVNLVKIGKKYMFQTAADLGWLMARQATEQKKLSRAALETLAIVAYHQPVTRAEVEQIRGVAVAKGTMDVLLETGWVRLRGRRKAPGRPVTYGTTEGFLVHFGLESISDLPGLDELKGAGLFDGRLPQGFGVPAPRDDSALTEDEDPLEDGDTLGEFAPEPPANEDQGDLLAQGSDDAKSA